MEFLSVSIDIIKDDLVSLNSIHFFIRYCLSQKLMCILVWNQYSEFSNKRLSIDSVVK